MTPSTNGILIGKPESHNRDSHDLQNYATILRYKPEDLAATIYHALGIDHELRLPDTQGRPVGLMDYGQPIHELFG